jgi:hypothetical protein
MSRLTYLERRIMRYHGMPARDVARVEKLTVHEVLEVRAQLRERGHVPTTPGLDQGVYEQPQQLSLDQVDQLMRDNRAPRAVDGEGGWTTQTDGGW